MTYGDVWRRIVPEHPDIPPVLLRKWAGDAVDTLWQKYPWSFRQQVTSLAIAASRDVTCTVTQGSTSVTSTGAFVAGDLYRNFRVGTFPYYTVAAFVGVNEITLDRAYEEASATDTTGTILDALAICPSDWGSWWVVADVDNQRPIPYWFSEEDLIRADPARTAAETPRILVATSEVPAAVAAYAGRARFEWWPVGTAAKVFPAVYLKRSPAFVDTSNLPAVWDEDISALEAGISQRCARWPGPSSKPNGEFNLALAKTWGDEFLMLARQLYKTDRDRYPQAYTTTQWYRLGAFAYTSDQLRASDVSAGEYLSGAYSGYAW